MFSFEVKGSSLEEFMKKLHDSFERSGLSRLISIKREGSSFIVTFAKGGQSVFHFDVTSLGKGFTARLREKRVALMHLPFARDFEAKVRGIVEKIGGRSLD